MHLRRRPSPQRSPRTTATAPRQNDWETRLLTSTQPRTAEDSDEMWRHVRQEEQEWQERQSCPLHLMSLNSSNRSQDVWLLKCAACAGKFYSVSDRFRRECLWRQICFLAGFGYWPSALILAPRLQDQVFKPTLFPALSLWHLPSASRPYPERMQIAYCASKPILSGNQLALVYVIEETVFLCKKKHLQKLIKLMHLVASSRQRGKVVSWRVQ